MQTQAGGGLRTTYDARPWMKPPGSAPMDAATNDTTKAGLRRGGKVKRKGYQLGGLIRRGLGYVAKNKARTGIGAAIGGVTANDAVSAAQNTTSPIENPVVRSAAAGLDTLAGTDLFSNVASGGRTQTPTSAFEAEGLGPAKLAESNAGRLAQDVGTRAKGVAGETVRDWAPIGEMLLGGANKVASTLSGGAVTVPSGRDIYDYYANKLGYAKGGRVQRGLRQRFERGGRAGLIKRAATWLSPLEQRAAQARAKITDVLPKKQVKKVGTIEAPELRKAPPEYVGSKAPPAKEPPAGMGTKETARTDIAVEQPKGIRRIFSKTPQVPAQAATQLDRLGGLRKAGQRAWGATKLGLALPVGVAAYGATRNLMGEGDQGAGTAAAAAPEATAAPEFATPGSVTPTGVSVGAPRGTPAPDTNFLKTQGVDLAQAGQAVPEGLRRTIVQQATPDPGAFINLGNYGGNAAIFGTSSAPGGRVNRFVGQGGVGGVSPEQAAANAERLAQGQQVAKGESDQLTSAIQARLASGNPEDLDFARRLAVTPEHQAMIAEAEKHAMLQQGATTPLGRKQLLDYEAGLRAAQAAAPANQMAVLKFLTGQKQQAFENQIKAGTAAANIAKVQSDIGDAGMKRFNSSVDQILPPSVKGQPNLDNAAFKAFMYRSAAERGVPIGSLTPEMVSTYYSRFNTLKAQQPDIVDRALAWAGLGTAVAPTTVQDVTGMAVTPGVFEPQVETPTGQRVPMSTYTAVPGTGLRLPFGMGTLFPAKSASLTREALALPYYPGGLRR
jgi:hypothetical protein